MSPQSIRDVVAYLFFKMTFCKSTNTVNVNTMRRNIKETPQTVWFDELDKEKQDALCPMIDPKA